MFVIFATLLPNEASLLRLVSAVLVEISEESDSTSQWTPLPSGEQFP
jgi:hypothetical protein